MTRTRVVQRAAEIRREAGQPIVLFVGRLVPYKGVDVLLEALKGVDAAALIVGDGPLRAALEAQARALGVAEPVRFLGSVADEELAALYRACDVFVLPSVTRQEAFGVVQLEAMAAGKPVVSTDLGTGVGWVNRHGETGFVVPPRDPRRASRGASRRLLADADLQKSMGTRRGERVRVGVYGRADDRRHARALPRRDGDGRPWQNGCLTWCCPAAG